MFQLNYILAKLYLSTFNDIDLVFDQELLTAAAVLRVLLFNLLFLKHRTRLIAHIRI